MASSLTQVTAAPPPAAARSIDEQLFRAGSWRCLDPDNRALRDVRPGTLDQALDLLGRGRVASFYGQLRPGVVAVDIDMARSDGPVMELVGWCCEQGLWHLVRPSGRRGHQHVFVVVGDRRDDLDRFATTVRSAHGVTNVRINVRDKIRPLCAPHRCEPTPPLPPLGHAARSLPRALQQLAEVEIPLRTQYGASTAAKAVPAPYRQRQDLPPAWARYLAEGVHPPQVSNWSDQSRSAVEYRATMRMVLAGWSADRAWLAITTSHHHAMEKARANGRAWWTAYVWNPAVTALAQHAAPSSSQTRDNSPPTGGPNPDVGTRAQALQAAFLTVWTRYGRDRRHTLRAVLDAVCARITRTGSATVPCPERDLVLDTGIASRRALREALAVLDSEGWLRLHRTFDPGRDEPEARSHHVGLPERSPVWIPHSGLKYPPSSYTPLPLPVRTHLGPALHHAYLALPQDLPAACLPLLPLMGLGPPSEAPPSQDQLATALSRLQSLAALGLAVCDEQGRWVAVAQVPTELLTAAKESHAQRVQSVNEDRAAYALVRAGRGLWARERQNAIERWRSDVHHAAQRWFQGLPPAEQFARRDAWQLRFSALPPTRQAQIKHELARRRAEAGVTSEDAVRRAWIEAISPEQFAERVIERTLAFRALPPPLQAAKAAAWADHRARWGISLDPTPPPARPAQVVSEARTNEQLELLALADVLERDPHGRLAGLQPGRRKTEATA